MRGVVLTAVFLALALGAQAQPATANLQGRASETRAFVENPHMKAFYGLSVARLKGVAQPDVEAYERDAYAHFRAFGASMDRDPEAMVDHLKAIPRQVVQIAREDPAVLDSYDNFIAALLGPP